MSPVPVLLISRIVKFFTQLSDQREQASVVRAVTRIWMWPRRPVTLASILVVGIAAGARSADSVDWNRQAEEDAQAGLHDDHLRRPSTQSVGLRHDRSSHARRLVGDRDAWRRAYRTAAGQPRVHLPQPRSGKDLDTDVSDRFGHQVEGPNPGDHALGADAQRQACHHGLAGSQRRVWRVEDVFRPQRRLVPHVVGIGASAGQAGGSNHDPQRDQDPRRTDSHAVSTLQPLRRNGAQDLERPCLSIRLAIRAPA